MLRLPRPPVPFRRSLVSSVLLNRSWDTATLPDLRSEAKARGLSHKGNKATIVARLQQHDSNLAKAPEPSARKASTDAAPPDVQIARPETIPPPMGEKGIAPGIPPNSIQSSSAKLLLNIKLPDLTQPDPIPPVQIPYLPDFWESSTPKKVLEEQPLPKLLVVGDASAYHGGGPTHNLPEETIRSEPGAKAEPDLPGTGGVFSDIAGDLGLSSWGEIRKNWRRMLP